MDAAFGKVCDVFGFSTLNEYQENALKFVIEKKKDVFVNVPTGFGKSVIFQGFSAVVCICGTKPRKKVYSNRRFSRRKPGEGPSQPAVVSGHKRYIAKQRNVMRG